MGIETLDDIVQQIANWIGVYGAHHPDDAPEDESECACRCCVVSSLTSRIREAVRIETILAKADADPTTGAKQ